MYLFLPQQALDAMREEISAPPGRLGASRVPCGALRLRLNAPNCTPRSPCGYDLLDAVLLADKAYDADASWTRHLPEHSEPLEPEGEARLLFVPVQAAKYRRAFLQQTQALLPHRHTLRKTLRQIPRHARACLGAHPHAWLCVKLLARNLQWIGVDRQSMKSLTFCHLRKQQRRHFCVSQIVVVDHQMIKTRPTAPLSSCGP